MKGRLQKGAFAMYIPNGMICELIKNHGRGYCADVHYSEIWEIKFKSRVVTFEGNLKMQGYCPHFELMPLGDEESKKQFEKEKELENA